MGWLLITGLNNLSLLRASHIKPWRVSSNRERLDPMNGFLLQQPTLDHLFDSGLITFDKDGVVVFSPELSRDDIEKLKLADNYKLKKTPGRLKIYIKYHRNYVFKSG